MSQAGRRKIRVARKLAGVVMPARDFIEGEDFLTIISRKPGVVLEVRRDGVAVSIEGEPEVRRIHPDVRLVHE